jgi:hypothetical protein
MIDEVWRFQNLQTLKALVLFGSDHNQQVRYNAKAGRQIMMTSRASVMPEDCLRAQLSEQMR